MASITLSNNGKQSKGRNGWFTPARAAILHGPLDTIAVEVWSKRESGEPPIDLYLSPKDAAELGRALLAMAEQEMEQYPTGYRVEGGKPGTEDYDTGTVVAATNATATVAWDSGVTTTQPADLLRRLS